MADAEDQPLETPTVSTTQSSEPTEPAWVQALREENARNAAAIAALTQQVLSQRRPEPPANDVTDDDLWQQAQQGNRLAFEEYQRRIARREYQGSFQANQHDQAVGAQLQALFRMYPEFSNAQHPLRQKAEQFKSALLQMGSPNTRATDLDAMLRAVADSRDIIAAPRGEMRTTTPGGGGQMGAQHRRPPARTDDGTPAPTAEEQALASKMGIKDAAAATKKFWDRQERGRSTVSPAVQSALNVREG